tara:strand:+ start:8582 stop:10486 length:1905 start_codon:yes stop_codon:yes gene_type:complete
LCFQHDIDAIAVGAIAPVKSSQILLGYCKVLARAKARRIVCALISLHLAMQCFAALNNSITVDEIPTLAAGISNWTTANFGLNRVNPPLVRMVAAAPVLVLGYVPDDWQAPQETLRRLDHHAGVKLINGWGESAFRIHAIGRLPVLVFTAIGAYFCYLWSSALHDERAGVVACLLWCFAPSVLTHGHLVTTDVAATALGLVANYYFWRWLQTTASSSESPRSSWVAAFLAGMLLGLAELSKTTWVVLYLVWPGIWALWRCSSQTKSLKLAGREALQLSVAMAVSIYIINLGYGFEGTGERLGNFRFASEPLGVANSSDFYSNRFAGTLLGQLPVPLPRNYVQGIDMQKRGFEQEIQMYLNGKWKTGGWWYYYLYGALIKIPIAGLVLFACSIALQVTSKCSGDLWRSLAVLVVPAIVIFVLVSSQTAINRHTRYILPCMPLLFILSSGVFSRSSAGWTRRAIGRFFSSMLLIWYVVSSIWIFPHSTTYFNELAGGPFNGPKLILGSSVDWGQDLLYLKRWLDAHPEAEPIGVAYGLYRLSPRLAGIEYSLVPPGLESKRPRVAGEATGPRPGWYAVAVKRIYDSHQTHRYFLDFTPTDYAGYSMYIYHLKEDEVERYWKSVNATPHARHAFPED